MNFKERDMNGGVVGNVGDDELTVRFGVADVWGIMESGRKKIGAGNGIPITNVFFTLGDLHIYKRKETQYSFCYKLTITV